MTFMACNTPKLCTRLLQVVFCNFLGYSFSTISVPDIKALIVLKSLVWLANSQNKKMNQGSKTSYLTELQN